MPPTAGLRVRSCADIKADRFAVRTFAAFEMPLAWICCTIEGVGVAPAAELIAADVRPRDMGVPICVIGFAALIPAAAIVTGFVPRPPLGANGAFGACSVENPPMLCGGFGGIGDAICGLGSGDLPSKGASIGGTCGLAFAVVPGGGIAPPV